jgi:hypothetical protein
MKHMSLTRAQWEELWESVKKIENVTLKSSLHMNRKQIILDNVAIIKAMVESVIGQME